MEAERGEELPSIYLVCTTESLSAKAFGTHEDECPSEPCIHCIPISYFGDFAFTCCKISPTRPNIKADIYLVASFRCYDFPPAFAPLSPAAPLVGVLGVARGQDVLQLLSDLITKHYYW